MRGRTLCVEAREAREAEQSRREGTGSRLSLSGPSPALEKKFGRVTSGLRKRMPKK
jgi:hypothetical protein